MAKLKSIAKALVPLVVFAASSLVNVQFDWKTPSGWVAFAVAVLTSVGVYLKRNEPLPAPAPPPQG